MYARRLVSWPVGLLLLMALEMSSCGPPPAYPLAYAGSEKDAAREVATTYLYKKDLDLFLQGAHVTVVQFIPRPTPNPPPRAWEKQFSVTFKKHDWFHNETRTITVTVRKYKNEQGAYYKVVNSSEHQQSVQ